jgi:integral membrane protein
MLGIVNPVRMLRVVGIAEGISFLVLLFVAMPLKHFFGHPAAVRGFGMLHGALFLVFVPVLLRAAIERGWPIKTSALVFGAALLPFGFVAIDRILRDEIAREEHEG